MQNNSKQVTAVTQVRNPGLDHQSTEGLEGREWIREIQVTDSKSLGV